MFCILRAFTKSATRKINWRTNRKYGLKSNKSPEKALSFWNGLVTICKDFYYVSVSAGILFASNAAAFSFLIRSTNKKIDDTNTKVDETKRETNEKFEEINHGLSLILEKMDSQRDFIETYVSERILLHENRGQKQHITSLINQRKD